MTTPSVLPPGLFHEPDAVYRQKAAHNLSSHALSDFRKSPWLFHKKEQGLIPDADSSAFLVGRAAHALILEGRGVFDAGYVVGGPINEKTGKCFGRETKAFQEWAAGTDKDVLSDAQAVLVESMAAGVAQHPIAPAMLAEGHAEVVARTTYGSVPCQGRIDYISPAWGIVDLKTCDDLTWFEADARRFGYIYQMAFYRALVRVATGRIEPVNIIAIEKHEPFRCGVWCIAPAVLDQAERENRDAMRRLEVCRKNDSWPTGYEDIRSFDYL